MMTSGRSEYPVHVTPDQYVTRLRALLRPRGGQRGWPGRRLDRWVLLHALARRIAPGERLAEREANGRIQNWLLGPASRLTVDHVTLRRALVDEGFWDRESGGHDYRRSEVHLHRVRFEDPLPGDEQILEEADRPSPPAPR